MTDETVLPRETMARTLHAFIGAALNPMPGICATDWGTTYHWERLQISATNAGNFYFKSPPPEFEHGKVETPEHMAQLLALIKE